MFKLFLAPLLTFGVFPLVNFPALPYFSSKQEVEQPKISLPKKTDRFYFSALAKLIGDAESHGAGGYNAANSGYPGDLGTNGLKTFSGKDCSEITIGQVKQWQRKGLLFAVGRYQMVPRTFRAAQIWAGLKDHDYFNPENQDKMLLAIIKNKRPSVWAYIRGEGSLNKAINSLAMEWAALPTLSGFSYYSGYNGNYASVKVNAVKAALAKTKEAYQLTL